MRGLLRSLFNPRQSEPDPLVSYERDGWAVHRGVIDVDLIEEARRHIGWLQGRHPTVRPESLGHTLMTNDPFWVRLVADHSLLDIAEQFIGPNIALFASAYICKPPHDGQPVLWHQDGSYWPLNPMQVVSLWLALDDSTPENGCMRVIPRSHKSELGRLLPRTDIPNVLLSGMDESRFDPGEATDVVLRAGDVSIHHPNIVHGSDPNYSDHRRCGLTIRYIPTTTRILTDDERPFPSAFLLRGNPMREINRYNPWPQFDPGRHMWFRGCETFGRGRAH